MAIAFPFSERYQAGSSPVHRADPRVKLAVTVAYVFAIAFTAVGAWAVLALLALPVLAAIALARLPAALVLRRSLLALPFVLAAVPLAFTKPGDTVFELPLLGWTASREGIEATTTILAKSWLSVLAAVVLTTATPATDLVRALQGLHVPKLLTAVVFFTYRYLFTIGEEAGRLVRGRDSRSARLAGYRSGGSIPWRARVVGHMVGSLFLRSFERSERVYAAMQARGYDGELRFLSEHPLRRREVAAGVLIVLYGLAVQAAARV
ncbi:MAG: cobalt ECF transporter T component CbiQ [Dehalococcoidia bacterium]